MDALHSDLREELHRRADADLVKRSGIGGFAFLMFLLVIGLTTPYRLEHPATFTFACAAIGISVTIRIALRSRLTSLLSKPRSHLLTPLVVAIWLAKGSISWMYVSAIASDGLTGWTCVLLLIQIVAISAGSTIAFTPNFSLVILNIAILLGPAALFSLSAFGREGAVFAICLAVAAAFLLLQARWLHRMYWDLLTDRSLEEIRIFEVRSARASADAAHQEARYYATHDPVTAILNRRGVIARLHHEFQRAKVDRSVLSVLLLDIDHFKVINETYGLPAGDRVLRSTAERLKDTLREDDVIGRFGAEEFLVILSGCDTAQATMSAERLRAAIPDRPVLSGSLQVPLTISVGVASIQPSLGCVGDLIAIAERSLYEAKHPASIESQHLAASAMNRSRL